MDSSNEVLPAFFRTTAELSAEDRRADLACRWGASGPRTQVAPGVHALGAPEAHAPVLVTGNNRLTFDTLRSALRGANCWILAVDTAGLDIASAVVAGRFSTAEVEKAVRVSRLALLVANRVLVIPGRAAAVVESGLLASHTGFSAVPGPNRAVHLPAFLTAGCLPATGASEELFDVRERLSVMPRLLVRSLQGGAAFAFAAILYAGLGPEGVNMGRALAGCWPLLIMGAAAVIAGVVIAPLPPALPPLRLFSLNGLLSGAAVTGALLHGAGLARGFSPFLILGCWLFFPAASGVLSSLYATAAPGVASVSPSRERRFLLPAALTLFALSVAAFALAKRS